MLSESIQISFKDFRSLNDSPLDNPTWKEHGYTFISSDTNKENLPASQASTTVLLVFVRLNTPLTQQESKPIFNLHSLEVAKSKNSCSL